MDNNDLYLKDWETAKKNIVHFDDIVIRMRLEGIPIAITVLTIGFAEFQYTRGIKVFGSYPAAGFIPLFGAIYLFGIFLLDFLHFKLMLNAVNLAKEIESMPQFKGKLKITTRLTSPFYTIWHEIVVSIIYLAVIILELSFAWYFFVA